MLHDHAGWEQVSLTEVLDFREGPGIMARDFREHGVPLLRLAGLKRGASLLDGCNYLDDEMVSTRWDHFRVRLADVLLSTSASLGEVAVVDESAVGAVPYTGIIRFRPSGNRIVPEFVQFALTAPTFKRQVEEMGVGSVMRHFGPTHLVKMTIDLPPVPMQEAIASVLGALDDKIAVNGRIMTRSSEMISALYGRALEGPKARLPMSQAVEFDFGAPFSSDFFNDQGRGYPLLRIRDLKTWKPDVWTTQRLPGDTLIEPGDVVAGMDAEFRPTFWLGKPALLNQRVLRGRSRITGGANSFVREVLRDPFREAERYKTGTTVAHLNKRDLMASTVHVPTTNALEIFEAVAGPLRKEMVLAMLESTKLTELRDVLLPRLMSGELRVRDAERIVEDAT